MADLQEAPAPAGKRYGEPGKSSYKREPDFAFVKPATDVVLLGHAHAPRGKATEATVGVKVGPVEKTVRVVGDRVWVKSVALLVTAPLLTVVAGL